MVLTKIMNDCELYLSYFELSATTNAHWII